MKFLNALTIVSVCIANAVAKNCWAEELGFKCCSSSDAKVEYTDNDGKWSIEDGNWCGILKKPECWALELGFECCTSEDIEVQYTDKDGKWGIENYEWCGIIEKEKPITKPVEEPTTIPVDEPSETTEPVSTTTVVDDSTPSPIRDISSKELIKEMNFGWNLGNTMDAQCIEYLNYEKDQTASETCWGNPKTTEDMFKVLMDNQFNVFRIPTTWSGHFGEAPDYKIDEK
ncbi:cellulase-domain-containing protein [Neocallimastix lanati (nom. inval.)]|jgi:hypothetical protein|uniref:Cellulase-domain-containing protein n=1 Tax=Neocallimastix californiae TaxID=1754190 RepID=A0A1Y2F246_9FUNG|nr:cellulase-domain-containing protein [Neocallimastix sp. JGI-2020a]ORY77426.1 cellulase-domain-containing protein [Neocallimastix californiae]|eukprot:ORY77426.1 cellulase-domain-containing protein [Neocallimastix californiae]